MATDTILSSIVGRLGLHFERVWASLGQLWDALGRLLDPLGLALEDLALPLTPQLQATSLQSFAAASERSITRLRSIARALAAAQALQRTNSPKGCAERATAPSRRTWCTLEAVIDCSGTPSTGSRAAARSIDLDAAGKTPSGPLRESCLPCIAAAAPGACSWGSSSR